jgi:hypothetical protein
MALPKPVRPEYTCTIPSTGKKIKYQPFSVKEEKILILASESQDTDEVSNAIGNVLNSCITTSGINVEDLALFDIEFLFLRTRAKSVGEKLQVVVTDPNDETYTTEHEIDIDKIQVIKQKEHSDTIKISEDTVVKMKYPDLNFFAEGINVNTINDRLDLAASCIKQIAVGEEVYNKEDMSAGEAEEWLEALTSEQFGKVMQFFTTMPRLSHTIKLKNPNTGEYFTIVLEGLSDFF